MDMLSYSLPVLIANISFIINEHIDKIMIPKLLPGAVGDRDLGIYGAVSKIAVFLSIAVQAFRLRSEEHTSELQSLMRISYAVFCLKKQTYTKANQNTNV